MDAMDFGDESDNDLVFTQMLENIQDWSQSHPNVNQREYRYIIPDRISQRQSEWKGELKTTRNTSKGLHKVSKTIVKYISQYFPPLGKSGSEVAHFIPEPRNVSEVTKLSDDKKNLG